MFKNQQIKLRTLTFISPACLQFSFMCKSLPVIHVRLWTFQGLWTLMLTQKKKKQINNALPTAAWQTEIITSSPQLICVSSALWIQTICRMFCCESLLHGASSLVTTQLWCTTFTVNSSAGSPVGASTQDAALPCRCLQQRCGNVLVARKKENEDRPDNFSATLVQLVHC